MPLPSFASLLRRPPERPCQRPGCGHPHAAHEHYRRGTDCSVAGCACRQFVGSRVQGYLLGKRSRPPSPAG